MAIKFYYASGSPYAWRVWLALEHKSLTYELKVLSFSAGDLQKPDFLALNPRHKVPVIVDDGFALYESAAIAEYLEDAYPASGNRLFPTAVRQRALARRLIREADQYVAEAMEKMVEEILFKPMADWNSENIERAKDDYLKQLAYFENELKGEFLAGEVGMADFTLYPLVALALRMELKKADLAISSGIGPKLRAWMRRVEALPHYAKTYPPHWKAA